MHCYSALVSCHVCNHWPAARASLGWGLTVRQMASHVKEGALKFSRVCAFSGSFLSLRSAESGCRWLAYSSLPTWGTPLCFLIHFYHHSNKMFSCALTSLFFRMNNISRWTLKVIIGQSSQNNNCLQAADQGVAQTILLLQRGVRSFSLLLSRAVIKQFQCISIFLT